MNQEISPFEILNIAHTSDKPSFVADPCHLLFSSQLAAECVREA